MRDILISSAVCVACLLVALISQLVAPSTVVASPPAEAALASTATAGAPSPPAPAAAPAIASPLELDPDDTNPALFTMAPAESAAASAASDPTLASAAALGGEMAAPKERVTASGLRVTDLVVGEGAEASAGETVVVNYRGTLINGKEFDSSYGRGPFSFPLGGGRVIAGWDEGVAGMRVGGKRRLVIPPDLAYGSRGAGGVIPPDATLIFEVELVRIAG
jgi:FKBP-type peptidyl-prolyl cis-trans isomerase